ncbi:hypothetical protein BGX24_008229 [Mortierella sp. AD032]|nr:hypothetical protein BGX24_008229 [Mortierella sp. AD032]
MTKVLARRRGLQRLDVTNDVDDSEREWGDGGESSTSDVAGTDISSDSEGQGTQVTEEDLTRAQSTPFYEHLQEDVLTRKIRSGNGSEYSKHTSQGFNLSPFIKT